MHEWEYIQAYVLNLLIIITRRTRNLSNFIKQLKTVHSLDIIIMEFKCIPNGKEAWAPWVEIDHFQIVRSAPLQLHNMKMKNTLHGRSSVSICLK